MTNFYAVLFIISLMAVIGSTQQLEAAEKGKVINMEFYLHHTTNGDNPTVVKIAQSTRTDESPSNFGQMIMQDDPLTKGPDPNSKLIGQLQGFIGYASESEIALVAALSFVFTDGPYKGSSISVLGREVLFSPQREMPVVGGTGVFRLARGFAISETYQINNITEDAIVHYNLTLVF